MCTGSSTDGGLLKLLYIETASSYVSIQIFYFRKLIFKQAWKQMGKP